MYWFEIKLYLLKNIQYIGNRMFKQAQELEAVVSE